MVYKEMSKLHDVKTRAERYLSNLSEAFKTLRIFKRSIDSEGLLDLAKRYFDDAKYYYEKGKYVDSIVCSTYSEGILDALKELKIISFNWPKGDKEEAKVFIAGTFDILHPGHIYLINEAAKLGKVFVVVARDVNVEKFKGRKPIISEEQRLYVISNIKGVYRAILGDVNDIFKSIEKVKPDIILLGPDQKISEKELKEVLRKRGLANVKIIRLERKFTKYPNCSSSSIIRKIVENYCK